MRRELWWGLIAVAVLAVASTCAPGYARFAVPYYAAGARLIAIGHPWQIAAVGVGPSNVGTGSVLMLIGDVRRRSDDARPAGRVIARVQVGEVVETPAVFWTMLLLWPAVSIRQRLMRIAIGLPIFLGLEGVTTLAQLVHNLPEVSALLAGEQDPVTWWEHWSRFLEAGGRFVVEVCAVLLTVAIGRCLPWERTAPGHGSSHVGACAVGLE